MRIGSIYRLILSSIWSDKCILKLIYLNSEILFINRWNINFKLLNLQWCMFQMYVISFPDLKKTKKQRCYINWKNKISRLIHVIYLDDINNKHMYIDKGYLPHFSPLWSLVPGDLDMIVQIQRISVVVQDIHAVEQV